MKRHRKISIVLICLIFGLALGAAAYSGYRAFYANKGPEGLQIFAKKTPKPDLTTNPLDGTEVEKSLANRHPLAIVIENHPDSRPQIGLDKASIIYEAITEGGITRYLAIYGPREAEKVGPVRSMRTFFLDWAWEYNAFLAHCGGNIDALDRIPVEGALDLDQFALGEKAYWREPQAGKAIEHTMFTSTAKLYAAAKEKGFEMTGDFTSLKFLKRLKESETSQTIIIDFSSASYRVGYTYDPSSKTYLRSLGAFAHKDRNTGNQLAPTNVIIQSVSREHAPTRINEESWTFETIGEGKADVFYGGQIFEATWKKPDLKARTKFYDSSGDEIEFLPGQFWYEIVPPEVFEKVKVEETPNPSASS